jgi:hypothetical protein
MATPTGTDYPAIPAPLPTLKALYESVDALKSNIEILPTRAGQRGFQAVTFNDLVSLGLLANLSGTTVGAQVITNAMLAGMPSKTIKSNITGAAAPPADNTLSALLDAVLTNVQGSVIYRDAGSGWTFLGPGTAGNFLQTAGASANPLWAAPGAGAGLVHLNTLTATAGVTTALSDTTSITAAYSEYLLTFEQIIPGTNAVTPQIVVSTNGGSSYITTAYIAMAVAIFDNLEVSSGDTSSTAVVLAAPTAGVNNNANYGLSGSVKLFNPLGTTTRKFFSGGTSYMYSTGITVAQLVFAPISGFWDGGNTAINAFQLNMSGGGTFSGKMRVYGLTP